MKAPTANELIDENLGGLELTMDDDMWKFYKDVIRQCIESRTQAHTKELREERDDFVARFSNSNLRAGELDAENKELGEQLKETENLLDGTTHNLKRLVTKYDKLWDRVKELEAILMPIANTHDVAIEIDPKGIANKMRNAAANGLKGRY